MYSRAAWGGAVEPHILVKFTKDSTQDESDPITSMVIFEWKDYDLIGVLPTADSITVTPTCEMVRANAKTSPERIHLR